MINHKKQAFDAMVKAMFVSRVPSERMTAPLRYMVGSFWINFSLIWPEAQKVLTVYANHAPQEFWDIAFAQLASVNTQLKDLPPSEVCCFVPRPTRRRGRKNEDEEEGEEEEEDEEAHTLRKRRHQPAGRVRANEQ
mgnify:CR=1 FL=1